jgi:hypothetical protein
MWPQERDYRRLVGGNLQYVIVSYRETDLAIGLLPGVWSDAVHREVLLLVRRLWRIWRNIWRLTRLCRQSCAL